MRSAILLLATLLLAAGDARASDVDRSPTWEERMLEAINADRAERGLPRYRVDRRLERAAAEHSRRMAETSTLAHQLRGEPPLKTRVAATGLRFDAVGENVGYSTRVEDLHGNLMRSRGHRQNLLATKYDVDRDRHLPERWSLVRHAGLRAHHQRVERVGSRGRVRGSDRDVAAQAPSAQRRDARQRRAALCRLRDGAS